MDSFKILLGIIAGVLLLAVIFTVYIALTSEPMQPSEEDSGSQFIFIPFIALIPVWVAILKKRKDEDKKEVKRDNDMMKFIALLGTTLLMVIVTLGIILILR
jgi:Co/Zn/Cd efflux system component